MLGAGHRAGGGPTDSDGLVSAISPPVKFRPKRPGWASQLVGNWRRLAASLRRAHVVGAPDVLARLVVDVLDRLLGTRASTHQHHGAITRVVQLVEGPGFMTAEPPSGKCMVHWPSIMNQV